MSAHALKIGWVAQAKARPRVVVSLVLGIIAVYGVVAFELATLR